VVESEERRRADGEGPSRISREARELIHDLLTGEERDCLVRVVRTVRDGESLKRYYRGPLREALQEIGTLWERGKVSVAQEHLSTSIVARMLADFLELDGWRVWYLGGSTPAGEILDICRRESPRLLCLSVTLPCGLMSAREIIRKVRRLPSCAGTKVMVGGHAFRLSREVWRKVEADGFAEDVDGGVELARNYVLEEMKLHG
jgi:methanogenic corrinoid protein MtbC1